jgi:hypothetical protein
MYYFEGIVIVNGEVGISGSRCKPYRKSPRAVIKGAPIDISPQLGRCAQRHHPLARYCCKQFLFLFPAAVDLKSAPPYRATHVNSSLQVSTFTPWMDPLDL